MTTNALLRHIPVGSLSASEPAPWMFGNSENEPTNKHWSNSNWLKSVFHFSFAEVRYRDPRRQQFGVLRVMNDDLVQPKRGFGTHPHSDMEICSYVVDGHITHQDSMGSAETLSRGAVQFMTAGTGVRHSEFNRHESDPLRFIQMWIVPRRRGLKPNYGSATVDPSERDGKWKHLAGDVERFAAKDVPVLINQDCSIFAAELKEGGSLPFVVEAGRRAYVLAIEAGKLNLGATDGGSDNETLSLAQQDAVEVDGNTAKDTQLEFVAAEGPAHILVVEMAGGH